MPTHILQNDSQSLKSLFAKLKEQEECNVILKSYLEPLLAKHCHVIHLEKQQLIVLVDNNHWVTKFRFQTPILLNQLRTHQKFAKLKAICCKVSPCYEPLKTPRESEKAIALTEKTAKILKEQSQKIRDEKLKKILQRIGTHRSSD